MTLKELYNLKEISKYDVLSVLFSFSLEEKRKFLKLNAIIFEKAKKGKVIYYDELEEALKLSSKKLRDYLGFIDLYYYLFLFDKKEIVFPTSFVVDRKTKLPDKEYFEFLKRLLKSRIKYVSEYELFKKVQEETQKILRG